MDPRFKAKMDNNAAWERVKDAAVKMAGPEESEHQVNTLAIYKCNKL